MGGGEFRVFLLCHLAAKISHCGLSCISLRLVILSIFSCTVVLSLKFHFWVSIAAAAAKSLQSCLTLCNPIDGSPPGSAVPGILQARTLVWVAISFSNEAVYKPPDQHGGHVKATQNIGRLMKGPWGQKCVLLNSASITDELWAWANHTLPEFVSSWWGPTSFPGEGSANHFSVLVLRTPWTVWKDKKIGHGKRNSPGR